MDGMRAMDGMRVPIFELEGAGCRFGGTEALAGVQLRIGPGERVALVGQSGAGKSTLLGLLNGSIAPTAGRVRILGQDLRRLGRSRRRRVQRQVGMIYQQLHLTENLRVIHNVNGGRLGHWPLWKAIASLVWPLEVAAAARALERVGIAEKLYERTDRLSGGQQQRVAIARVLVQDPAVILADEPISSLDPTRSRAVMDLLRDLSLETGKTLVASLHDVDFARSHFERLIGLRRGRVVFDRAAAAVDDACLAALYGEDSEAESERAND